MKVMWFINDITDKLSAIGGDSEDVESGYIESDRLDSGIPSSMAGMLILHGFIKFVDGSGAKVDSGWQHTVLVWCAS